MFKLEFLYFKFVFIDIEQQLTACKTRVIVLEEQNREYENTISLLHQQQRTDEIVEMLL
jgi:hypothetical protein